ncbi:hypothetical protein LXL04_026624 [Taraxacum kok-saghyz]
MVQHKAQLKKQQKRGVDFKKIKRKIGRKLPPPKNTTNTEVKSKAIVLPEQSLASEKGGLAVSKKGLTLKELLSQTSHHNAKVRRDALIGIRDIFLKHPAELKIHRLTVIEKLRERMTDEDRVVRETLYQLLKAVIFPGCKEDNQGTFISLMMAYVFNAMTHLAFDVRLMAFKFFDLVVQHYPMSFSMYAEKIIQHYKEMLQQNQFNLHDKGKLKSVLAGLAYCLSLLPSNKRDDNSSENVVADRIILHAFESQVHEDRSVYSVIAKELMGLLPILVGGLQDFIPSVQTSPSLETQSFDCVLSILKSIHLVVKFIVHGNGTQLKVSPPLGRRDENVLQMLLKKLFVVFPLNRTHESSEKEDNRYFILNVIVSEVFFCICDWSGLPCGFLDKFVLFIVDALSEKVMHSGKAFFQKHSLPFIPFIPKVMTQVDDTWKSHLVQAFTEVFKKCDPESSMKLVCLSAIEEMLFSKNICRVSEIVEFENTWIREIPLLLIQLGDKNPSSTKAVLRLQLRVGQCRISQEFDNMQSSLTHFYTHGEIDISYGPFMKLERELQELSISCLYYFSFLNPSLLQSLAACCLCQINSFAGQDLEPFISFRILEVVNCAYRVGHIQIADYISFLITLLSRGHETRIRSVTSAVCCCVSQIGDDGLVFKMIEGAVVDQISKNPPLPLDNTCALLRMIITLDSKPTRLCEESVSKLGKLLAGYLLDVVSNLPQDSSTRRYYMLPCFVLLSRSGRIVNCVLTSWSESSRVIAVVDALTVMHEGLPDTTREKEMDAILHNILRAITVCNKPLSFHLLYAVTYPSDSLFLLQSDNNFNIQEKHNIQRAYDRLKKLTAR